MNEIESDRNSILELYSSQLSAMMAFLWLRGLGRTGDEEGGGRHFWGVSFTNLSLSQTTDTDSSLSHEITQ